MNDSGFTGVPPRPLPSGQSKNAHSSKPHVRLISLPQEVQAELQTRRDSLRLQGEVVRQNDDGSVRIRTERGDIGIQLREDRPPPERGTRVEVEIQQSGKSAHPVETATLREVSRAERQTQPPRPSATPVDVELRPQGQTPLAHRPLPADISHPQRATTTPYARSLPPEGAVVRLQPLPAHTAQALPSTDILLQTISTILEPTAFQMHIFAQHAVSDLQNAVLTIQAPQAQTSGLLPALDNPVFTPQITSPAFAAFKPEVPLLVQPPTLKATPYIPKLNFSPAIAALLQIHPASIITQPLATVPKPAPLSIPLKSQALDVMIERVTPPTAHIIPAHPFLDNIQPTKPENLILQNQNVGSFTSIVTNITQEALPVLSVFFPQSGEEQFFTLQFPSENIAIGTQLQITPQAGPQPSAAAVSPHNMPLPAFLAPQPWPALNEALQTLSRAAPQTAQAFLNVTPSPANPAQLGPAVMFFVAAIRGGDLSQWLGGKATSILKAQKNAGALNRLLNDSANISRIAAEPAVQDWRAMNIPLYWDGEMHKIGLYYKREYEDSSDDQPKLKSTRFVFDLSLERMGKVQLDGLFKPGRLDLVVRTQEHFSQAMREEMRKVYAKALKDTQITGELSFQGEDARWVTIQAKNKKALGVSA